KLVNVPPLMLKTAPLPMLIAPALALVKEGLVPDWVTARATPEATLMAPLLVCLAEGLLRVVAQLTVTVPWLLSSAFRKRPPPALPSPQRISPVLVRVPAETVRVSFQPPSRVSRRIRPALVKPVAAVRAAWPTPEAPVPCTHTHCPSAMFPLRAL